MQGDLRQLIREVLAEELAAFRAHSLPPGPQKRVEMVSISSDADLTAFARRVLVLARDGKIAADIEAGRFEFRLGAGPAAGGPERPQAAGATAPVCFERGLITETQIQNLPEGATIVRAGKQARFTPLAKDALRKSGVRVERAPA